MNIDKHELKLLAASAAIAPFGQPIPVAALSGVFDRKGLLHKTVASLNRVGAILFDPYQSSFRVVGAVVWKMMNEFGNQTELFTSERPLDAVLAASGSNAVQNSGRPPGPCENTRAVCDFTQPQAICHQPFSHPFKQPKPPPKPPPKERDNSNVYGALQNFCGKTLRAASAVKTLQEPGTLPTQLLSLKERHKGIKPLMEFESLSEALADVETGSEPIAYEAMCGILGGVVMEGGDLDTYGNERMGDGGKWRNRWRTNRAKTHRVLAELVSEIKECSVKSRGGRAEGLWREFSGR